MMKLLNHTATTSDNYQLTASLEDVYLESIAENTGQELELKSLETGLEHLTLNIEHLKALQELDLTDCNDTLLKTTVSTISKQIGVDIATEGVVDTLKSAVVKTYEFIKSLVIKLWEWIKKAFNAVVDFFKRLSGTPAAKERYEENKKRALLDEKQIEKDVKKIVKEEKSKENKKEDNKVEENKVEDNKKEDSKTNTSSTASKKEIAEQVEKTPEFEETLNKVEKVIQKTEKDLTKEEIRNIAKELSVKYKTIEKYAINIKLLTIIASDGVGDSTIKNLEKLLEKYFGIINNILELVFYLKRLDKPNAESVEKILVSYRAKLTEYLSDSEINYPKLPDGKNYVIGVKVVKKTSDKNKKAFFYRYSLSLLNIRDKNQFSINKNFMLPKVESDKIYNKNKRLKPDDIVSPKDIDRILVKPIKKEIDVVAEELKNFTKVLDSKLKSTDNESDTKDMAEFSRMIANPIASANGMIVSIGTTISSIATMYRDFISVK